MARVRAGDLGLDAEPGPSFHPACAVFPLIVGPEFDELVADVKRNGLLEPIWRNREGLIIDGRNRFRACEQAGVTPIYRTWDGPESGLVEFVCAMNIHRRHLDESQRGMIAAKLANIPLGGNQHVVGGSIDLPTVTQTEAAELLKVGTATVKRARAVLDRGTPELVRAVEKGEVSVSAAAARVAPLPKEKRAKMLAEISSRKLPKDSVHEQALDDLLEFLVDWLARFGHVETLEPLLKTVRHTIAVVFRAQQGAAGAKASDPKAVGAE